MGLFQLLVWIEQKTGRAIDATAIDMVAQWDTVNAVVAFVERERR
jgi:acyl carrier protein